MDDPASNLNSVVQREVKAALAEVILPRLDQLEAAYAHREKIFTEQNENYAKLLTKCINLLAQYGSNAIQQQADLTVLADAYTKLAERTQDQNADGRSSVVSSLAALSCATALDVDALARLSLELSQSASIEFQTQNTTADNVVDDSREVYVEVEELGQLGKDDESVKVDFEDSNDTPVFPPTPVESSETLKGTPSTDLGTTSDVREPTDESLPPLNGSETLESSDDSIIVAETLESMINEVVATSQPSNSTNSTTSYLSLSISDINFDIPISPGTLSFGSSSIDFDTSIEDADTATEDTLDGTLIAGQEGIQSDNRDNINSSPSDDVCTPYISDTDESGDEEESMAVITTCFKNPTNNVKSPLFDTEAQEKEVSKNLTDEGDAVKNDTEVTSEDAYVDENDNDQEVFREVVLPDVNSSEAIPEQEDIPEATVENADVPKAVTEDSIDPEPISIDETIKEVTPDDEEVHQERESRFITVISPSKTVSKPEDHHPKSAQPIDARKIDFAHNEPPTTASSFGSFSKGFAAPFQRSPSDYSTSSTSSRISKESRSSKWGQNILKPRLSFSSSSEYPKKWVPHAVMNPLKNDFLLPQIPIFKKSLVPPASPFKTNLSSMARYPDVHTLSGKKAKLNFDRSNPVYPTPDDTRVTNCYAKHSSEKKHGFNAIAKIYLYDADQCGFVGEPVSGILKLIEIRKPCGRQSVTHVVMFKKNPDFDKPCLFNEPISSKTIIRQVTSMTCILDTVIGNDYRTYVIRFYKHGDSKKFETAYMQAKFLSFPC